MHDSLTRRKREGGFTLVELMVAMGILALLSLFLVRILTSSLAIWNWGEAPRACRLAGPRPLRSAARTSVSCSVSAP